MIEAEFSFQEERIIIKYDDELFRNRVEEYISSNECPDVEEYECFDDWALDIFMYMNESYDMCITEWSNDYTNLYDLPYYCKLSEIYYPCKNIITEVAMMGNQI